MSPFQVGLDCTLSYHRNLTIPQANHHPVVAQFPYQVILGLGILLRIVQSLKLLLYLLVFPEAIL